MPISKGSTDVTVDGITITQKANGDLQVSTITNAQVSSTAAIAYSKLNLTNSIANADMTANAIVNTNISSTAAIAFTKTENIGPAQVILGNSSSVPTATTFSGDITNNNTGLVNLPIFFGNGGDSATTFSAASTITTDKVYTDLTINAGILVNVTSGKMIRVNGTFTNNGTIAVLGAKSGGAAGNGAGTNGGGTGGTGGTSGGVLIINARTIAGTGNIQAHGFNGNAGSNGGTGNNATTDGNKGSPGTNGSIAGFTVTGSTGGTGAALDLQVLQVLQLFQI